MDVSSGVAAAVLAAAAVLLLLLRRRPERPVRSGYAATSPVGRDVDTLDAMVALGEAMSDANYTVNTVRETLDRVAQHHGLGSAEVIVLPTAIIVSSRARGQVLTRAVSTGFRPLTFHQVDSVDRIARSAREGTLTTTQVTTMARLMRDERQPFPAPTSASRPMPWHPVPCRCSSERRSRESASPWSSACSSAFCWG